MDNMKDENQLKSFLERERCKLAIQRQDYLESMYWEEIREVN
ncbi:hypothetical protein ADIARSV_3135 [Arcticibacter svalbardensis MN12-7]|uniref:Uncharacterized protein n=1 Tax=Arcticibacter svalbardensis MN12-7 TaxID=1150600 RepID=R9GXM2_9SPHI|nr:hypothetical protein ADIARSV_3135 [Arcticibacter svalbardensis MN12-7]